MKRQYYLLPIIIALFIAALAVAGCDTNREDKVDDAKDNVIQAKQELKDAEAEYEREWQQFKKDAELKIDANQVKIDEFKAEIKVASPKFKAKYEKEVAALELKNNELKKKISEYKYDGKDKWEEFKIEFNRDVDVVGNALKDIFANKE